MTYTIEYSKEADKTLRKWKKSNPNLFKKIGLFLNAFAIVHGRHLYGRFLVYGNRSTIFSNAALLISIPK